MNIEKITIGNTEYHLKEWVPASVAIEWISRFWTPKHNDTQIDEVDSQVARICKSYDSEMILMLAEHILCDGNGAPAKWDNVPLHHRPTLSRAFHARLHIGEFFKSLNQSAEEGEASEAESLKTEKVTDGPEKNLLNG